ncbi:hypothetical protein VEE30_38760 [Escherichia coli]|nr:hypothetical protein VEE30_38760 [Escherichia coli]
MGYGWTTNWTKTGFVAHCLFIRFEGGAFYAKLALIMKYLYVDNLAYPYAQMTVKGQWPEGKGVL